MSYKLATIQVKYRQNKNKSLEIDAKVPQWIADQLAIRYLELLDAETKSRPAKAAKAPKSTSNENIIS